MCSATRSRPTVHALARTFVATLLLTVVSSCVPSRELPKPSPRPSAQRAFVARYAVVQGPQGKYIYKNASGGLITEMELTCDGKGKIRFDDYPMHRRFNIWNVSEKLTYLCDNKNKIFTQESCPQSTTLVDERSCQMGKYVGMEKMKGYDCRHYRYEGGAGIWYHERDDWYSPQLNCSVKSDIKKVNGLTCSISLISYSDKQPNKQLFDLSSYRRVDIPEYYNAR